VALVRPTVRMALSPLRWPSPAGLVRPSNLETREPRLHPSPELPRVGSRRPAPAERWPSCAPARGIARRRVPTGLPLIHAPGRCAGSTDELPAVESEHHKLSGFFLVYHDLFDLTPRPAKGRRYRSRPFGATGSRRALGNLAGPGRGRGSSVSSIVCYASSAWFPTSIRSPTKLFSGAAS